MTSTRIWYVEQHEGRTKLCCFLDETFRSGGDEHHAWGVLRETIPAGDGPTWAGLCHLASLIEAGIQVALEEIRAA